MRKRLASESQSAKPWDGNQTIFFHHPTSPGSQDEPAATTRKTPAIQEDEAPVTLPDSAVMSAPIDSDMVDTCPMHDGDHADLAATLQREEPQAPTSLSDSDVMSVPAPDAHLVDQTLRVAEA